MIEYTARDESKILTSIFSFDNEFIQNSDFLQYRYKTHYVIFNLVFIILGPIKKIIYIDLFKSPIPLKPIIIGLLSLEHQVK